MFAFRYSGPVTWAYRALLAGVAARGIGTAGLASPENFGGAATGSQTQASSWSASAVVGLKESFDENVYLQSVTSNAFQHSFVTAVLPSVKIAYRPADAFHASLGYAPEITFFHSASKEDFTTHRVQFALDGTSSQTKWDLSENLIAIDGSDIGPSFYGPGGPPAGGGPQIRDRRDALVERGQARLAQSFGEWFVRPSLSGYLHDFKTLQKIEPGYQNYVDRDEWSFGADVGRQISDSCWVTLGYRYGQQDEGKLLNFPEHYNCTYHRALAGIEGKPWSWLTLSVCAGPEFRQFADSVAAGFGDRNQVCPFVDSIATALLSSRDTLSLSVKVFEQPGFSGRSVYLDSTYDGTWRHKFGSNLTVGAGFRAYNTDFLKPTQRNDWILTPTVVGSYAFTRHLSAELSYLYDDAFSLIPNTQGREYTRNVGALGVKYVF